MKNFPNFQNVLTFTPYYCFSKLLAKMVHIHPFYNYSYSEINNPLAKTCISILSREGSNTYGKFLHESVKGDISGFVLAKHEYIIIVRNYE